MVRALHLNDATQEQTRMCPASSIERPQTHSSGAVDPQELVRLEWMFAQQDFAAAEDLARRLICLEAEQPFAWKVLAACVSARDDGAQEAIVLYENAPESVSHDWQFHNNFGNTLKRAQRLAAACAQYRRALALHPGAFEPQYNLGATLIEAGDLAGAELCLRKALSMDASHGLSHVNLGNILQGRGKLAEAEAHYAAAMATMPEDARLLNNYGQLLAKQYRYPEAEALYRRAIVADPGFAAPCVNLAELLSGHGLLQEAETLLRHAVQIDPDLAKGHSNLLFLLSLRDGCDADTLLREHIAFAEHFETPLKPQWPMHANAREHNRVLRIGFVSGDLRDHPVVRYLVPALQRLREHTNLSLYAYSCTLQSDRYTDQYKTLFHHWRDIGVLPDGDVAGRIQADAIDILIDLAGHSGDNRMLTFARKPAPVQMSWMGYVGTTGLEAMDYVIADRDLVTDKMQTQFREKILYLPATTTFQTFTPSPTPSALPALTHGYMTFCCLARMNKLNRPLIALWSRILRAVPSSRMLLLTLPGGGQPDVLKTWFQVEGIPLDRLTFARARSVEDILDLHRHADLALDTFPYNGSTTISHALTRGIPTLTLRGCCVAGRLGTSIATKVGLTGWIAEDEADFVQKAIGWTERAHELAALRQQLPQRFADCVLCQHEYVTDTLVAQLRLAWIRWCDGLPPISL